MDRSELDELHYVSPICNVPSILRHGILSHNRVKVMRVQHHSVAMQEIQDRRAKVVVPGGRKLHDYANLYICARNPMMFKLRHQHQDLCVLRVHPSVIDLPGVAIADRNASSDYVRFETAPDGLDIVSYELAFAEYWTDVDPIVGWKKKAVKCAEVLVPGKVQPKYITGGYVSCQDAKSAFESLNTGLAVGINSYLFFM
jgi:acetyltransferase-like isoleucine patch superfamily enzyme